VAPSAMTCQSAEEDASGHLRLLGHKVSLSVADPTHGAAKIALLTC
jgi:hypothetical protein